MKKIFLIEVDDSRTVICYNYGCNHWYLCLKHKDSDSTMKDCVGFSSEPKYDKYMIDGMI